MKITSNNKVSLTNKLAFTTAALAVAFMANLSTAQAAHAEPSNESTAQQGQMIDDSGLVITSYADGSLCEFKLSVKELAALKLFNQNAVVVNQTNGQVLQTVIASSAAR